MTTVSLEAARLLKAAGYPQDQWPEMVWIANHSVFPEPSAGLRYAVDDKTPLPGEDFRDRLSSLGREGFSWYTAPDPLMALTWLAKEKGAKTDIHLATVQGDIFAIGQDRHDTPDDLIIAVCERLKL